MDACLEEIWCKHARDAGAIGIMCYRKQKGWRTCCTRSGEGEICKSNFAIDGSQSNVSAGKGGIVGY